MGGIENFERGYEAVKVESHEQTNQPFLSRIHLTAQQIRRVGALNNTTLREFYRFCLPPIEPLQPEQIRQTLEAAYDC